MQSEANGRTVTTPSQCLRTLSMCSRSISSNVASPTASPAMAPSSSMGARRLGPLERITDRSMKFSSSRTVPGHGQLTRARIVSDGIVTISRFILSAYFFVKCRARGRISSGRSRSGLDAGSCGHLRIACEWMTAARGILSTRMCAHAWQADAHFRQVRGSGDRNAVRLRPFSPQAWHDASPNLVEFILAPVPGLMSERTLS